MADIQNVDHFQIWKEDDTIHIEFTDILGFGAEFVFPVKDALQILDALLEVLGQEKHVP